MKILTRSLLIAGIVTTLSCLAMATPCVPVIADNIASNNGCLFGFPSDIFQFDNFSFVIYTQSNPGRLALTDNTIGFFTNGPFDGNVGLSVTGDSQWSISSADGVSRCPTP
jgi:hypothetical protein